MEISPKEKPILRIREDISITPIKVNVQSTGATEEDEIFNTEEDEETGEQIWQRKKDAKSFPTNQLPDISLEKLSTHSSTSPQKPTLQRLSNTPTMAIEQRNDVVLRQLRLKLQKEEYSETILQQHPRYGSYCSQIDRLSVQDVIVIRDYYDETGSIQYRQSLLPKHLVSELLQAPHGTANKHPGFSKMLYEIRQKCYYPRIAKIVKSWVQGCEICIKDKRIKKSSITPELLNLPNGTSGQKTPCK